MHDSWHLRYVSAGLTDPSVWFALALPLLLWFERFQYLTFWSLAVANLSVFLRVVWDTCFRLQPVDISAHMDAARANANLID